MSFALLLSIDWHLADSISASVFKSHFVASVPVSIVKFSVIKGGDSLTMTESTFDEITSSSSWSNSTLHSPRSLQASSSGFELIPSWSLIPRQRNTKTAQVIGRTFEVRLMVLMLRVLSLKRCDIVTVDLTVLCERHTIGV